MSRRKVYNESRVTFSVRLPPDLRERLEEAAVERELSMNWIMTRAIEIFLDELIPVEEFSLTERPSFTCPKCGRTSYHPEDVKNGYCGNCHWWTGDPLLSEVHPNG